MKNPILIDESSIWLTKDYPDSMTQVATALGKMRARIQPTDPKTSVGFSVHVTDTEGSLGWEKIRAAKEIEITLAIRQEGRDDIRVVLILEASSKRLEHEIGGGVRREIDSAELLKLANELVDLWYFGYEEPLPPRRAPGSTLGLPMPPKTRG